MTAIAVSNSRAALEAHIRRMMEWHFDPATGAPFWLDRAGSLGFDPRTDVRDLADLRRFPDLSEELRTVPVGRLIPRGRADRPYAVYESGGTMGRPKRIVEHESRLSNVEWVSEVLREHGFPERGDWLHVGPTGPHIVGRSVRRLAELRNSLCFTIDVDPRWVKRLVATERPDLVAEYVDHVLDQVDQIVVNQKISVLFITPPILEALIARTDLYERLTESVRGLIWSGTSIGPTSLKLVEEEFFADAAVAGIYGNSLMGIAPQRVRRPGDAYRCVFRPYWPNAQVEVIDPDTGERVPHGERGRVLVHLLSEDMFLPNVAERDTAVRLRPEDGAGVELADIQPYRGGSRTVIEGVY
ncbi:MAG TPA: AMP-binding protein [Amycolatopsis sp.]|uniref:AMP-binding protein n=1 Tax=Amycolatopsis sp. TaxID=37632 RepID=UPI002B45DAC8|nr:AMP-binding protein [Amycolatopsis sp.]HKS46128.1 AMP-binding protein [Amycolatopsis sp.]